MALFQDGGGLRHLGQTRSVSRGAYLLHTPDAFVRAALSGMERGTAIVHASPAIGADFLEYTAELESGGRLAPTEHQRFVFVMDGEATAMVDGVKTTLVAGDYMYAPASATAERLDFMATLASRVEVIEKAYLPLAGSSAPKAFAASEKDAPAQALGGDADLTVRSLLPADAAFDFAVNTMTYQPGAALAMVEAHVMEHGLMMLEGGGIYRLGDDWHAVEAGDFIWMAPYCPQWFGALGKKAAKYLIYKDWNRSPQL